MNSVEQQFFVDLERKLWTAADKLRSSLDASVYKHVVLGLIFLKYVSDAFEERQKELRTQFQNPEHDYYMAPADYPDGYDTALAAELEVRDYYTEKNVFWVPLEARWQTLRDCAQLPPKAPLPWKKTGKDEPEDMRTVGWLIDNAMEAVERENTKLKNVLNKQFANTQIESPKLSDLIAHFSDTDFNRKEYNGHPLNLQSKDILGHVYEYFLGQFALAEGKKGGQYYTPKSIVTLIVEMLQPFKGRVYDPAMGSGGFFVQSEEFIAEHGGAVVKGKTGPRAFREMNGSDRVRACFQHCVLQYVLRKQMTNQSLRERFGLSESNGNTVSQIITATVEQRLIKNDPNAPDSKRYARYIPAWA